MESGPQKEKELFSSVIADIKSYTGDDPLRPWLHGIRRMKASLPPHVLREKLPRFLQKCAQTFESNPRYRNDSRYLRVWIQLMDHVNDARRVLRKMEKNGIGLKRAMFYSAYALYYEKRKKFEDAEKMFHMGAQNLAEPAEELQKSYEQFLHRMKLVKKRMSTLQEAMSSQGKSTCKHIPTHPGKTKISNYKIDGGEASQVSLPNTNLEHHQLNFEHNKLIEGCSKFVGGSNGSTNCMEMTRKLSVSEEQTSFSNPSEVSSCKARSVSCSFPTKDEQGTMAAKRFLEHQGNTDMDLDRLTPFRSDDTVVVKFVDSAIVGKSEAEDACHHGLVDPTINTKEAMNAISSMFREPLDQEPIVKRSHRSKPKADQLSSGFEVYIDENLEERTNSSHQNPKKGAKNSSDIQSSDQLEFENSDSSKLMEMEFQKPFIGAFKILADDDEDDGCGDGECVERRTQSKPLPSVCTKPNYLNSMSCKEPNTLNAPHSGLREDTVIRRFVGSTVFGDPEVENACHHGLVDPTINLKEAMDDINSMFGKPLNFVKASKPNKRNNVFDQKPASLGFSILADDDLEDSKGKTSSSFSCKLDGGDLFEPTVFTKEAMDEINDMFGKPLDF